MYDVGSFGSSYTFFVEKLTRVRLRGYILCLAAAIGSSSSTVAQLPAVIDLNVTPGTESAPLTRIYGDDADDLQISFAPYQHVAFGDIDGDGAHDVIIGATTADSTDGTNVGEVYVLPGSAFSAGGSIDMNTAPGSQGELRVLGDNAAEYAGGSVAAADVNGDGIDDLIIGAFGGNFSDGVTYIIYGGAGLFGTTIDLNSTPGSNGETRIIGNSADQFSGNAVATGDINGDGYADILIGVRFVTPNSGGAMYVVYGGPALGGTTIDLTDPLATTGATYILGNDDNDVMGLTAACADINGDGFDDLVFSAHQADTPVSSFGGVAFIVYGSATLPETSIDLGSAPGTYGETRIYGDDFADHLGTSLAVGYVNDDAYADVLLGARFGNGNHGESYVIYGSETLPGTEVDLANPIGANGETRISHLLSGEQLGSSAATGDINGDGLDDLVSGAFFADPGGINDAGGARLVYGSASLPGTNIDFGAGGGDVIIHGDDAVDRLGGACAAGGDVNQDGFADFIITAGLGNNPSIGAGENNAGTYALIFGDGTGNTGTCRRRFPAGNTRWHGFGGRLSCVLRTYLRFNDGTDGTVVATITRNTLGISNGPAPADRAEVTWELTTDRTGWSSAEVRFRYLDSEILGLSEADLKLYHAPNASGPWTEVAVQSLDTSRNEVTATLDSFSHFVLATDLKGPAGLPAGRLAALSLLAGLLMILGLRALRKRIVQS